MAASLTSPVCAARRAATPSVPCRTSTVRPVFPARHQPRAATPSVLCHTSTASLCGQHQLRPVLHAGPQPRASAPCRTSTATICGQCSLPDPNRDHLQPVFPAGHQPRERMPGRMSEDMPEIRMNSGRYVRKNVRKNVTRYVRKSVTGEVRKHVRSVLSLRACCLSCLYRAVLSGITLKSASNSAFAAQGPDPALGLVWAFHFRQMINGTREQLPFKGRVA